MDVLLHRTNESGAPNKFSVVSAQKVSEKSSAVVLRGQDEALLRNSPGSMERQRTGSRLFTPRAGYGERGRNGGGTTQAECEVTRSVSRRRLKTEAERNSVLCSCIL